MAVSRRVQAQLLTTMPVSHFSASMAAAGSTIPTCRLHSRQIIILNARAYSSLNDEAYDFMQYIPSKDSDKNRTRSAFARQESAPLSTSRGKSASTADERRNNLSKQSEDSKSDQVPKAVKEREARVSKFMNYATKTQSKNISSEMQRPNALDALYVHYLDKNSKMFRNSTKLESLKGVVHGSIKPPGARVAGHDKYRSGNLPTAKSFSAAMAAIKFERLNKRGSIAEDKRAIADLKAGGRPDTFKEKAVSVRTTPKDKSAKFKVKGSKTRTETETWSWAQNAAETILLSDHLTIDFVSADGSYRKNISFRTAKEMCPTNHALVRIGSADSVPVIKSIKRPDSVESATNIKASKKTISEPKEVVISWSISDHDLSHQKAHAIELALKRHEDVHVKCGKDREFPKSEARRQEIIKAVVNLCSEIGAKLVKTEKDNEKNILKFRRVDTMSSEEEDEYDDEHY
ncbi:uncharacterized protein V2V93DRAFT_364094 [Kockiozyma suomiensis]|uniref:uncharacterized protein n=1 Tax=Kockiozyma suomiensis TaxID=1337062 RepID=UPI003343AB9E